MTTLFVGDVHSCADELGQMLEIAQPGRVILLGDMFNKGPDPEGTGSLSKSGMPKRYWETTMLPFWNGQSREMFGYPNPPCHGLKLCRSPLKEMAGWLYAGLPPEDVLLTQKHAINLRRWPDDRQASNPFGGSCIGESSWCCTDTMRRAACKITARRPWASIQGAYMGIG